MMSSGDGDRKKLEVVERSQERRATDSLETLLLGAQNLINGHDLNILKGHGSMNRHERIHSVHAQVYMRAGIAYVKYEGTMQVMNVLELASVDVMPEYRKHGFFHWLLKGLERLADENGRLLRVENVLNPDVARYVEALGYVKDPSNEVSYYRIMPTRD